MAVFDIKAVRPVVPTRLYDELNGELRSGSLDATARIDHGFLVAGLTSQQLDTYLTNSDEIGSLIHGLGNDLVKHATMPGDIARNQLVLVLDPKTRAHLAADVPSIVQPDVKWSMFILPDSIDDDNNGNAFSKRIMREGQPVIVDFNSIPDYFAKNGVTGSGVSDGLVEQPIDEEDPLDLSDDDLELNESDIKDDDMTIKESADDVEIDISDFGQTAEEPVEDMIQQDIDNDVLPPMADDDDDLGLPNLDDEDDLGLDLDTDDEEETYDDDDFGTSEIAVPSTTPAPTIQKDEGIESDTVVPAELLEGFNKLIKPVITPFKPNIVHHAAVREANRAVENTNHNIEQQYTGIRQSMLADYNKRIADLLSQTDSDLDPHTGKAVIKSEYEKRVIVPNEELAKSNSEKLSAYSSELEEKFMGDDFEAFKEDLLRHAEEMYREKYYEDRVKTPVTNFEMKLHDQLDEEQVSNETKFESWINELRTRAQIINQKSIAADVLAKATDDYKALVKDAYKSAEKLGEYSQDLIALEYREEARHDYSQSPDGQADNSDKIEELQSEIASLRREYQTVISDKTNLEYDLTEVKSTLETTRNDLSARDYQIKSLENENSQLRVSAPAESQATSELDAPKQVVPKAEPVEDTKQTKSKFLGFGRKK